MRKNRQAFTLVELIVVISILAILATIAFISLQGYTSSANNGKVRSDVMSLAKKIDIGAINGVGLQSFVGNYKNELVNPVVAGSGSVNHYDYYAGDYNYGVAGLKEVDFVDPYKEEKYKVGVTKRKTGRYEVSGTIMDNGYKFAYLNGSYTSRKAIDTRSTIINGAGTSEVVIQTNNNLYSGDYVITDGTNPTVVKINKLNLTHNSGNTLSLSGNIPADATYIQLAKDEVTGLLMGYDTNSNTGVIVNNGEYLPY